MRKILAYVLSLLLLTGPLAELAPAKVGGLSRSRSYSSGSRRSTSPSPRGRSYSSGRRPMGGSSSTRRSTPPRPPSGGTSSTPRSGTRPSPAPTPPPVTRSPAGKSYSSRRPTDGGAGSPGTGTRPRGGTWGRSAAEAQRRAESRRAFTKGNQPRTTYTDPRGVTRSLDPRDRRIDHLRRELDYERWANRDLRQRSFFGGFYSRPLVFFNDPFSSFFWWWLLAQSLDTRAMWAHHHRDAMDDARYKELVKEDAELEARIKELEKKGVPRDPTYHPEGMDPDLMYTDEHVDAVYNPQPNATAESRPAPPASTPKSQDRSPPTSTTTPISFLGGLIRFVLRALAVMALLVVGLVLLVWFVFVKRWGGGRSYSSRGW